MKKNLILFLIISTPVMCALAILGVYIISTWGSVAQVAGPVVEIYEPLHLMGVSVDDVVTVRAVARDPQGIQRVEFWADDDLVHVSTSQLPGGSNPFPLIADWQPRSLGSHTLIIRAYNQLGSSGLAAVSVNALDTPKPGPKGAYEARSGDTLESLAEEHHTTVDEILEHNPDADVEVAPGDTLLIPPSADEEDPPDVPTPLPFPEALPEDGPPELTLPVEPSLLRRMRLPRLFEPRPAPVRELYVEALTLEVDKEYDGVVCYFSLAGSAVERVPAEGSLLNEGERLWNISTEMASESRRTITIPEDQTWLDVEAHCRGLTVTEGFGIVLDLGSLETKHFDYDWDGRPLEHSISGPHGGFRVVYRISGPSGEGGGDPDDPPFTILPPANLKTTFWAGEGYGFNFDYPARSADAVDGFLLFRNGAMIRDVATPFRDYHIPDSEYTRWFIPLSESDFYPTCPQINEFFLTAYLDVPEYGRIESSHSNVATVDGDPTGCYERKGVKTTFEHLHVWCVMVDDGVHDLPCHIATAYDEDGNAIGCQTNCNPDVTWGAPDGKIWVNGEEVVSMWGGVESGRIYTLPSPFLHVDPDEASAIMTLEPLDSLTVTMKWWDYDVWSEEDKFCHGEHTITANELYAIRISEFRRKTYTLNFDGGGGSCLLHFSVEVLWP